MTGSGGSGMYDKVPPKAGESFVFAALPFDPAFDDVFHVAMVPAADAVGLRCIRIDQTSHAGDSVAEALRQIVMCAAMVADLTGAHPNVMYEVGYAHALGKPVVQICATGHAELPFTVRNRDTLTYRPGGTFHLMPVLRDYLSALLDGGLGQFP